jgi:hypothetical protein
MEKLLRRWRIRDLIALVALLFGHSAASLYA